MVVAHPARSKRCVFCNRWIGNANLKLKSANSGYEFNGMVNGKCAKTNATIVAQASIAEKCDFFDPSMEARRFM